MCGLAGIICSDNISNIKEKVFKMSSSLFHRGPDDGGVWADGNFGLGHRRLSIIDPSTAGAQPMKSHCNRFVLAYNGEIYNHLELRKSLENEFEGNKWRGNSDTETLLEAIAHWGIDKTLQRSYGMFALALWDQKNKSLILARDRIGEKPLYWGWAGKDFVFGSELKALRNHPDFYNQISLEALSQFFRFNYIPSPRSIYLNIYKLEPGTILNVYNHHPLTPPKKPIRPGQHYGNLSIRRYWDLNSEIEKGARNFISDEIEAVSALDMTLSKAVRKQMISDVPLGAFLSGGVDSSAIVALMQNQSTRPIKTFTIGFKEKSYDESSHALNVAKYLGTDHTNLNVTYKDVLEVISDIPFSYDEPFADSSQIPTYLICKLARQEVTVALSGDGADEIFGGYNRYIYGPKIYKYLSKLPNPLKKLFVFLSKNTSLTIWDKLEIIYNKIRTGSSGIANLGHKTHGLAEILNLSNNNIDEFHLNIASNWIEPEKLFKDFIVEPNSQFYDPMPDCGTENHASRMMFQDMRTYLPDDILCKVDRSAMNFSLETRAPFLDPDVIRLSMQLPTRMKIRNGLSKWALRQVLYKHVPQELIERPKVGFSVPIGLWLRGPLREWAEDKLSQERINKDGLFNYDIIKKIWSEHLSGRRDWTNRIWSFLVFQTWYES